MCWNPDISFNTFFIGILILVFIYVTNTYTKYKTPEFDNPWAYAFVLSFLLIQLMEFFMWRNLKNPSMNRTISWIMFFILSCQPLILMLLIDNPSVKRTLLAFYILYLIVHTGYIYQYTPSVMHTKIGHNGHLDWDFIVTKTNIDRLFLLIYCCICFPIFYYLKLKTFVFFTIISLALSMFFYYNNNTFGTMWCWMANLFLFYFLIQILFVKPFMEYNRLC